MKDNNRARLLVQLGVAESPVQVARSNRKARPSGCLEKRIILAVDDEPSSLELITMALESAAFDVLTAQSVREAKKFLQSRDDLALILTDLRMPEEDGFAFLTYLSGNLRFGSIPVIMLTSVADNAFVTRAIELGAIDYISKPFRPETLVTRVTRALERRRGTTVIVSDDTSTRMILTRMLANACGRIEAVTDAASALSLLDRVNADLLISELALADMTGLDLLLAVRDRNLEIPFVFLKDSQLRVPDHAILSAGGYGVIERPFFNQEVVRLVRAVISQCRYRLRVEPPRDGSTGHRE
jgi:DNA-binding response OmpR family regulator